MTQGDKVRAMSNEELTVWRFSEDWCDGGWRFCNKPISCEQCLLEYLNEEVEEN